MILHFHFCVCIQRKQNQYIKDISVLMFTAALFTIAKIWKQPKCLLIDKWIKKRGMYIQWNITQL